MSDTNLEIPLSLQPGDICVEVIGNEPRFWSVTQTETGKTKLQQVARSFVYLRQRVIQHISSDPTVIGAMDNASDLTASQLYSRKDRTNGAKLVKKYFPETKAVHFFYSGRGPSGQNWWGAGEKTHYSIHT